MRKRGKWLDELGETATRSIAGRTSRLTALHSQGYVGFVCAEALRDFACLASRPANRTLGRVQLRNLE